LKEIQSVQILAGLCGKVSKEMASAAKLASMGSMTLLIQSRELVFPVLLRQVIQLL